MANRELRILASEIIPSGEKIKYYSIDFPEGWFDKLSAIYKVIKCRDKVTLPVESLNEALEALPLGIIEVNNKYSNDKRYYKPWIIASKNIDTNIILKIVKSWCCIEFISKENLKEEIINKMSEILEQLKVEDINVKENFLDMSENNILENGTANPNAVIYSVLGNFIAQKIAEEQQNIMIGEEVFNFIRYKNKLISIPVKEYKKCYYSINITFEVKTIAGYSNPILLIDTGISRWANGKLADTIGWKDKTSVLIRYNNNSDEFNGFTLGSDMIKKSYDGEGYQWANDVKDILEDATLAYIPSLDKVLEKSTDYIGNNERYTMFISYNNNNIGSHSVKKGMSMQEKYIVCKQINEKFNFLKPIGNNEYKDIKGKYSGSALKHKKHEIIEYLDELEVTDNELTIEIIYINKNTPNLIAKEILNSIEESKYLIEFEDNKNITLMYKGLKLNIKSILAGNLVEPMNGFTAKVKEVTNMFPKTTVKTLSIVEIYDKKKYRNNDPKFAIRKGLYESNRFNQFINSDNISVLNEENKQKREKGEQKIKPLIKNVILELFRQLGVMHDEITLKGLKEMPENLEIIGFNLLSTNQNRKYDTLSYPIAVSIRTGEKEIYVKTPVNDWMLYRDAVIRLGSLNDKQKLYDENEINKFFSGILNDANENDSLVLVDTSNRLNSILKDFQDRNIQLNCKYNEYNNVRIIRVKNNSDVPKVVGVNSEDNAYFTSGLKEIVNNVYYSVQGKETTYQGIWESNRKLTSPGKEFKIPGTLEIVPVKLNTTDNINEFAYFTHILRNLNITYGDLSSVPVVNHLAKSFQEVLLVKDIEVKEE
jgi:hypothetical protein